MIILRQKEFNSKAAKALNNKYLKNVAAKVGIPTYESKNFKTVEIDPRIWKHQTKIGLKAKRNDNPGELTTNFNQYISNKSPLEGASHRTGGNNKINVTKKSRKYYDLKAYDHDLSRDNVRKSRLINSPLKKI